MIPLCLLMLKCKYEQVCWTYLDSRAERRTCTQLQQVFYCPGSKGLLAIGPPFILSTRLMVGNAMLTLAQ